MNNLNQCSDKIDQPDLLQDLNIVKPSAPPVDDELYLNYEKPNNVEHLQYTDLSKHDQDKTHRNSKLSYDIKAPGKLVEIPDLNEKARKRRRVRQIKRTAGILGWILCSPLMLLGLCIRDKPDVNEDDEWRDDLCLPCYYDVDFRYPGQR